MPLVARVTLRHRIVRIRKHTLHWRCACADHCSAPAISEPPPFPALPHLSSLPMSQHKYDLVLSGGHVLDPKNHRDGIMDIAIKDGKIVDVAAAHCKPGYDQDHSA